MTKIACEVSTCSHHKDGQCYANFVSIAGANADRECDTCCSSFLDRTVYSNLTANTIGEGACDCLDCKANTCKYNENAICMRGDIEVGGDGAVVYNETKCRSFEKRN